MFAFRVFPCRTRLLLTSLFASHSGSVSVTQGATHRIRSSEAGGPAAVCVSVTTRLPSKTLPPTGPRAARCEEEEEEELCVASACLYPQLRLGETPQGRRAAVTGELKETQWTREKDWVVYITKFSSATFAALWKEREIWSCTRETNTTAQLGKGREMKKGKQFVSGSFPSGLQGSSSSLQTGQRAFSSRVYCVGGVRWRCGDVPLHKLFPSSSLMLGSATQPGPSWNNWEAHNQSKQPQHVGSILDLVSRTQSVTARTPKLWINWIVNFN